MIFLLFTFTLSWVPYLLNLIRDSTIDNAEDVLRQVCPMDPPESSADLASKGVDLVWIQLKIQEILNDPEGPNDFSYAFPFENCSLVPLCSMAHKAHHSYRADYLQLWSICVGVVQSVLNPVVYAFWYPQFRSQAAALLGRVRASWKRREYWGPRIGLP